MNAETLIEVLQQIPDKKLPIRLAVPKRVMMMSILTIGYTAYLYITKVILVMSRTVK